MARRLVVARFRFRPGQSDGGQRSCGSAQSPFAAFQGGIGLGVQPYELAQIVSMITPLVASLLQSRSYQGHFGQFLPRAA